MENMLACTATDTLAARAPSKGFQQRHAHPVVSSVNAPGTGPRTRRDHVSCRDKKALRVGHTLSKVLGGRPLHGWSVRLATGHGVHRSQDDGIGRADD